MPQNLPNDNFPLEIFEEPRSAKAERGASSNPFKELVDPSGELKELTDVREDFELKETLIRLERLEHELKERKSHLDLREKYAPKAYAFVTNSVNFLFAILLLTGFFNILFQGVGQVKNFQFLSDTVLVALISGVTVNVLAVFLAVIRNLFPTIGKDDPAPPSSSSTAAKPPDSTAK